MPFSRNAATTWEALMLSSRSMVTTALERAFSSETNGCA
jgi:hypothetical protein